ncbi:class C sortase [Gulosibacter sediminis]|uniref:class C sortase n=1 Tax=Gulosibacter sediminis TaxID=1729695 RepID=UPI001867B11F|nr:class C sortase [Gulosibacter sediminis]
MSTTTEQPTQPASDGDAVELQQLRTYHSKRITSTWRSRLVLAIVMLLGVGLITYPFMAGWFSQANQSLLGDSYQSEVHDFTAADRAAALQAAREYNATLNSGAAFDPFTMRIGDEQSEQYKEYLRQLEGIPTGVMARIRIPSIGVNLPIYHGTSEATLLQGVGHLFGTSLPVGGEGTHSVLTGHSGLADAVLFTNLSRMEPGDRIYIDVYGETLAYEMYDSDTVIPTDTESLRMQPGEDLLTLVTCTPIGINSHRLLIHAARVPLDTTPELAEESVDSPEVPGFPWWIVWSAASVLLAGAYVAFGGSSQGRHAAQPAPREGKETDDA